MPSLGYDQLGGSFWPNAGKAARGLVCNTYSKWPKWSVGGVEVASPGWKAAVGILDGICKDDDEYVPPPQPSKQFDGGQCPCGLYNVKVKGRANVGTPSETDVTYDQQAYGKIGGIYVKSLGGTPPSYEMGIQAQGYPSIGCTPAPIQIPIATGSRESMGTFSVIEVTRIDGLPDNCGDPKPDYPTPYKFDPSPGDLVRNPVVPDSRGRGINLPIGIVTSPLVSADFEVNVDVGGVTFEFNVDKVEFNFGNKGSGSGTPGEFDGVPADTKRLEQKIDDLTDLTDDTRERVNVTKDLAQKNDSRAEEQQRKPPNDPSYEAEQKPEGDQDEEGIQGLKWVIVDLTRLPSQGNMIVDTVGQNIAYCGWIEFRVKGRGLPRQQLNYPYNIFAAPESADGYAVTFTKGARGIVTVVKKKSSP